MAASDARLVERIPHDESGEELRELTGATRGAVRVLLQRAAIGLSPRRSCRTSLRGSGDMPRLRPHKASVRTWLYAIARNRIVDARRRASVRPGLAPEEEEKPPRSSTASSITPFCAGRSRRALARLSSEHREGDQARALGRAQPARDRRAQGDPARHGEEPACTRCRACVSSSTRWRSSGDRLPRPRRCWAATSLGALEPAEMEAMRLHLESCLRCAREERKLAGPALLDTIEPGDVPPRALT